MQVQNKLQLATPLLPQAVQQLGIKVTKSSSSFLLVLAFVSEDGSMNKYDLANYVASKVAGSDQPDRRRRRTVTLFGSQYAMRIWLDPNKLTNYGLTPVDVTTAIAEPERADRGRRARRHAGGAGADAAGDHHGSHAAAARLSSSATSC